MGKKKLKNRIPLVSICIPAYNEEKYITRCINSVLSQTYKNIEIIIGDDASSDNTTKIIKSINDYRIKYFRNENNLGWRLNVKKCYQLVSGDFVTMLPADDYLHEKFVETAIEIFRNYSNVGIWACGNVSVDINGKKLGSEIRPKLGLIKSKDYFKYTYSMKNISPPSETMVRKKCFDFVDGYRCYDDDNYKQFPEINLYLKVALSGFDAYHSEDLLTYRVIRKDSLSSKFGNKAWVLNDNYNIFYEYININLVDNELIKSTDNKLAFKVLGKVKYNVKHFNLLEVLKAFNILFHRDFICIKVGFIHKIIRINNLIFQYLKSLIKKHYQK
jgi:glycosyltransferase involved in cell wall biosynthesis